MNGEADGGGAIYGDCAAVNCTFINNHASGFGGAMYGKGFSAVNCICDVKNRYWN